MVLNKTDDNFNEELFFTLNLLQENIYTVNIFPSNSTREDFLRTLSLSWDIFPPGERNEDIRRILKTQRNISQETIEKTTKKYDYLTSFKPVELIFGLSGMRRYFGAKFSDNLVVFENLNYGNAVYVLFENWEELSHLSRTEIQHRPSDEFIRIKHNKNWKTRLEKIISNKRP